MTDTSSPFKSRWMALAILAVLLPAPQERSAKIKLDKGERKGVKSITGRELVKYVAHLASDEMEGREAGSDAGHRAGDFIASEFERLGLKPAGEKGTYFQTFAVPYADLTTMPRLDLLDADGQRLTSYAFREDYTIWMGGYADSGQVEGPVYWVNEGSHDDYDSNRDKNKRRDLEITLGAS